MPFPAVVYEETFSQKCLDKSICKEFTAILPPYFITCIVAHIYSIMSCISQSVVLRHILTSFRECIYIM